MDKNKETVNRPGGSFSIEERKKIINEFLTTSCSKSAIWMKYAGKAYDHGEINRWMRQLGLKPEVRPSCRVGKKNIILPIQSLSVVKEEEKEQSSEELKKQIKELKKELETAMLKAEGLELMIEVAEKELNIPIRKKSDTK